MSSHEEDNRTLDDRQWAEEYLRHGDPPGVCNLVGVEKTKRILGIVEPQEGAQAREVSGQDPRGELWDKIQAAGSKRLKARKFQDWFQSKQDYDKFCQEYVSLLWEHLNDLGYPDGPEKFLGELEEKEIEGVARAMKKDGFSENTIAECVKILSEDIRRRLKALREKDDFKFLVKDKPLAHPWIKRENGTIAKIRELYKQCTTLSKNRSIARHMAHVFAATGFWTDTDHGSSEKKGESRQVKYFQRLRMRFSTIDRQSKQNPR